MTMPMPTSSPTRRLLRTREATAYLGMSAWTLRHLVWSGELPVVVHGPGSPWLFDLQDLERYIDEHKQTFPR